MNGTETVSGYLSAVGLDSWVVQVFVVVFVTAVLAFGTRRMAARLRSAFARTRSVWDESFVEALGPPLRAFIWIAGIAFAIEIIQNEAEAAIFEAVGPIRDVGLIATFAWFAVRFIRIAERNFIADKQAKGEEFDRATLDAMVKLLRLSVLITALSRRPADPRLQHLRGACLRRNRRHRGGIRGRRTCSPTSSAG